MPAKRSLDEPDGDGGDVPEGKRPRPDLRKSTGMKTAASEKSQIEAARKPTGGHVHASGRAIDDALAPDTAFTNKAKVDKLLTDKGYKQNTFRIHYKGTRTADGMTSGSLLEGAHIKRSSWTTWQRKLSRNFGGKLKAEDGFIGAPNRYGTHGSEIAHIRPQHTGGMTDEIGAHSASWHFNVEDMAREEGQQNLFKLYGYKVRIKSTFYIHDSGDLAGTVKAGRHKIYFQDGEGNWYKKFDHLQDGARGNINVSETRELKGRVAGLGLDSPNAHLGKSSAQKGISPFSNISHQAHFVPEANNSMASPYLTDLKMKDATGTMRTVSKASSGSAMKGFIKGFAKMFKL